MIETTALRNIHCQTRATAFSRIPATEELHEVTYRKVPRSPDQEFAARIEKYGRPIQFPQSVISLILQKQTRAEVGPSGIAIKFQKTSYRYWSDESAVCHNQRGEKVLCTFDPDDMSVIHVLTDDGCYIESVPQKNKISWFDDAALRDEMRKKAHSLNRDLAQFQAIHKDTSEEKINRVISNAQKMQIVNTMPCGAAPAAERSPEADLVDRFPKADRLRYASESVAGQRRGHTEQRERMRKTTARASNLLDREDEQKEDIFEEPVTARRFTAATLL